MNYIPSPPYFVSDTNANMQLPTIDDLDSAIVQLTGCHQELVTLLQNNYLAALTSCDKFREAISTQFRDTGYEQEDYANNLTALATYESTLNAQYQKVYGELRDDYMKTYRWYVDVTQQKLDQNNMKEISLEFEKFKLPQYN